VLPFVTTALAFRPGSAFDRLNTSRSHCMKRPDWCAEEASNVPGLGFGDDTIKGYNPKARGGVFSPATLNRPVLFHKRVGCLIRQS